MQVSTTGLNWCGLQLRSDLRTTCIEFINLLLHSYILSAWAFTTLPESLELIINFDMSSTAHDMRRLFSYSFLKNSLKASGVSLKFFICCLISTLSSKSFFLSDLNKYHTIHRQNTYQWPQKQFWPREVDELVSFWHDLQKHI